MSKRDDGGPAYPQDGATRRNEATGEWENAAPGMSLRDYFAGQALLGILAATVNQSFDDKEAEMRAIVPSAYAIADVMLQHRSQS